MPTKAELVSEIYLLLAAIHLHGFVMSQEMASRIFDRWPVVIGERPDSPEDIIDNFNAILQQRPARILAKDPAEHVAKTETPEHSQSEKVVEKVIKDSSKIEPSRTHKPVKNSNKDKDTPSPFSLASHSRKPTFKSTPKVTSKIASKTTFKATPIPTPRTAKLEVPATIHKKEPTDEPSLAIKPIFAVKRDFINLADDISSDEEDDTPSKKPRMG